MQLGERLEAGLGTSRLFRTFLTRRLSNFFSFFFLKDVGHTEVISNSYAKFPGRTHAICEALLKGAMCCVFKPQYVIVKLAVTPLYNYHKQMRLQCRWLVALVSHQLYRCWRLSKIRPHSPYTHLLTIPLFCSKEYMLPTAFCWQNGLNKIFHSFLYSSCRITRGLSS